MKILGEVDYDGRKMKVAIVEIEKLRFNSMNPNVMQQPDQRYLEDNIKAYGFLEFPVVGKTSNGDLMVMDGAHRIIALKDLGKTEVPVILVEDLDDVAIIAGAYTFNKAKGRIDPKLATELIYGLVKNWGLEVARKWLSLPMDKLKEYISQQELEKEIAVVKKQIEEQQKEVISKVAEKEIEKVKQAVVEQKRELSTIPIESIPQTMILFVPQDKYDFVVENLKKLDSNLGNALIKLIELAIASKLI